MSLAELLVALVTFGLVAAAAFTLLDESQRAWAFGVARAETMYIVGTRGSTLLIGDRRA